MPSIESYLILKREALGPHYNGDDIQIAEEAAEILISNGSDPYLLELLGKPINGGTRREPLIPRIYEGKVKWGGHVTCAAAGVVYDPIIGTPMDEGVFLDTAFYKPVTFVEQLTYAPRLTQP